jgi:hypothetical protein
VQLQQRPDLVGFVSVGALPHPCARYTASVQAGEPLRDTLGRLPRAKYLNFCCSFAAYRPIRSALELRW